MKRYVKPVLRLLTSADVTATKSAALIAKRHHERCMTISRRIMKRDRELLSALAKDD